MPWRRALPVLLVLVLRLTAQPTLPTVTQPIPAQTFAPGAGPATIDLRHHFNVPGILGQIVQFDTVLGRFNVELRADAAPLHVANFLDYVQAGSYAGSFIHRSAPLDPTGAIAIVQGGGYTWTASGAAEIAKAGVVPLEYSLPNTRGTLAAARTSNPNSATSEWFFNVRDNSAILGPPNGGGYTVFGRVLGSGLAVLDAIAALPRVNASGGDPGSAFAELPVRDYTGGAITETSLAIVHSIVPVAVHPGLGPSVMSYSVAGNTAPGVAGAVISDSHLTLTPLAGGETVVTVRATDTNGNSVETTLNVSVTAVAPVFSEQPVSQRIATGSTVVFRAHAAGAAAYRWRRNGVEIPGATSALLVVPDATAANAGTYSSVATNVIGSTTSAAAELIVVEASPPDAGKLVNLSIHTHLSAGEMMTMGTVLGGAGTDPVRSAPILVRAAGPALDAIADAYGPGDVLADPTLSLRVQANGSLVGSNENWGGATALAEAFDQVGAFPFPDPTSTDAALLQGNLPAAGYSVEVLGAGGGSGNVIAELYDATPAQAFTATTPRLVNLSVLKELAEGGLLTAGFVLDGSTARTLLIRAIGPGLAQFEGLDEMPDPRITLFDAGGTAIAMNDDWGGDPQVAAVAQRVAPGFTITDPASRDAMLLITLAAPAAYTVQVSPKGAGGYVIVEVYEVP